MSSTGFCKNHARAKLVGVDGLVFEAQGHVEDVHILPMSPGGG